MNQLLLPNEGAGSLSTQIYVRVVEAILRGDFGITGKLPSESELALTYGVSRPTVREALSRLRSDGVIDSRRGAGTSVIRMPHAPAPSMTPIRSLADIERYYTFRSCVESGAAAAAAEYRTSEDIDELNQAYEALHSKMEGGSPGIDEDVVFHLAVARCSHNPFFVTTLETSVAPIRQFMELARNVQDKKSPERVSMTQAEHRAVIDAIIRRAPRDAAEAIRIHILNAKQRIFEATPVL
jgi:GntR family transcriptional regulator, transcriptional repressor for pyruvate dehydrogenase complex